MNVDFFVLQLPNAKIYIACGNDLLIIIHGRDAVPIFRDGVSFIFNYKVNQRGKKQKIHRKEDQLTRS